MPSIHAGEGWSPGRMTSIDARVPFTTRVIIPSLVVGTVFFQWCISSVFCSSWQKKCRWEPLCRIPFLFVRSFCWLLNPFCNRRKSYVISLFLAHKHIDSNSTAGRMTPILQPWPVPPGRLTSLGVQTRTKKIPPGGWISMAILKKMPIISPVWGYWSVLKGSM